MDTLTARADRLEAELPELGQRERLALAAENPPGKAIGATTEEPATPEAA